MQAGSPWTTFWEQKTIIYLGKVLDNLFNKIKGAGNMTNSLQAPCCLLAGIVPLMLSIPCKAYQVNMWKKFLSFELSLYFPLPFSLIIIILHLSKNVYQPTGAKRGLKCHLYLIYFLKYYFMVFLVTIIKKKRWSEGIFFPPKLFYLYKYRTRIVP